MCGHKAAITCVARGPGIIVTGSNDGTVTVWATVKGRELALYPWFEPVQTFEFGKKYVSNCVPRCQQRLSLLLSSHAHNCPGYLLVTATAG